MSKRGWTLCAVIDSVLSRIRAGQVAMPRNRRLLYPFVNNRAAKCTVLLACLLSPGIAIGQYSGNVQGTIFDPAKQVVADANVLLTKIDTGVTSNTKSNSSGLYRF